MNQNTRTFASKQEEQRLNFQKQQDDLLYIHMQEVEKMKNAYSRKRKIAEAHTGRKNEPLTTYQSFNTTSAKRHPLP
jgi:hypothetical protein